MTQEEFDAIRMMALDESINGVDLKNAMRLHTSISHLQWKADNTGITLSELKSSLQSVQEYIEKDIMNLIGKIKEQYDTGYLLAYEDWEGYLSEEEWKAIKQFKARGMIGPQEI